MEDRYSKYVKIWERAEEVIISDRKSERLQALMDIESADKKFNLKLDELLKADDIDFMYDYCGIRGYIKRTEFPAKDFGSFVPRFAEKQ